VLILAFSDLHRDQRAARSLVARAAQVDVVAAVGDFASMHRGLEDIIDVLRAIDRPVLLVPGNNETDVALRAIQQRRPRLVLCGHIHQRWGQESRVGDVPVRNLGPAGAVIDLDAGAP
jgi:Icc-related predicted phosphoesterase